MKQELRNAFGRVFLTIEVMPTDRWVYVNWMGYLTPDNIRTGAEAYIKVLQEQGYTCVLNNTRLIVGSWDHSMDWVIQDWAPRAAKSGLKRLAMISTPETFGEASASRFYTDLTAFQTQLFDDKSKAEQWLRQYSLVNH
ncbi:STAS/SEC14 domain-containing protein [Pontibacter sp. JH31]|uniref:STAS/SEC14 domain-containing protein n=1 Tax=Pontibacter aquaedesilientis TaxID=2766980 RepID=A0ABR7XBU3_9BACT|nr:STAS/SEC14 domain-containing protein [Pontibacter aquaedesilientis]MBD1395785.1 STAS/SEC14 domain-containing protein [Pontibacter aquaedesilientis]